MKNPQNKKNADLLGKLRTAIKFLETLRKELTSQRFYVYAGGVLVQIDQLKDTQIRLRDSFKKE